MRMDVIHYAIPQGPQFEEGSFMDLIYRGNLVEAQDGPTDLLCTKFICRIALIMSLRQGCHLHPVFGIEFSNLLHDRLILILEICLLGD